MSDLCRYFDVKEDGKNPLLSLCMELRPKDVIKFLQRLFLQKKKRKKKGYFEKQPGEEGSEKKQTIFNDFSSKM